MNMQRLHGWSFVILCAVASLLGGIGYRARGLLLPAWKRLSKARRLLVIALTAAVILAGRLVANRHKPDEQFADVMVAIGVLVALGLVGVYRIMSNSSHAHGSRR